MRFEDEFIGSCLCWDDFWRRATSLATDAEKGATFERLTQLYLQTAPEYQSTLRAVWTLAEVPTDVRTRLHLVKRDEGIDLIAETRRGEYWAIQCKFRSNRDQPLTWRELSTFTSLAFVSCRGIALAVVAHTCSKPVGKRHLMGNTVEIGLDRWLSLDDEAWSLLQTKLNRKRPHPQPRTPMPHQQAAIEAATTHFVQNGAARGRLIMPCGTGKSLTAFWIAEALKTKSILVAVSSLALVRQSLADWTREYLARGIIPDWVCVCSDDTVGKLDEDEFVSEAYDLGIPTHTDPTEIAALIQSPSEAPLIMFATYQSSDKAAEAATRARRTFDLAILDEAHKTVGTHSRKFATLLSEKKIKARRRLFMTATERVFRGDDEEVLSMDSEQDYGGRFYQLSFKDAIEQKIISDYKVLTLSVGEQHIRKLIEENRILNLAPHDLDETEAQSLASGVALKHVYEKQKIKHAISFHRSIRSADRFREQQDILNFMPQWPSSINLHISSRKTAGQRADLMKQFTRHKRALMTNARCLTEGVDVPAIDCVLFADPKQSVVDIVQASGRALRRHTGKEFGYILLPVIVPDDMDFGNFAETTAFRQVARTIAALSTQDERIAEEFRAIKYGHRSSGRIIEIEGDVPVGAKMSVTEFAEAISTRVWERVARVNWKKFEDARAFVHKLGLRSQGDWREYALSGNKPDDIPSTPERTYQNTGWAGYGDWLGTGTIAPRLRIYRSFKEARNFSRQLGLKSHVEWWRWTKGQLKRDGLPDKPADIPAAPERTYASQWKNWADWLGTTRRIGDWLPFKEARAHVRRMNLASGKDWEVLVRNRGNRKGRKLRPDIPSQPDNVYPEWIGWWDWFGTNNRRGHWKPYHSARALVRELGLENERQYLRWRSGQLKCRIPPPVDMPMHPDRSYPEFTGWNDFLGCTLVVPMPFSEARQFARGLGLKNQQEFRDWSLGRLRRRGLPPRPHNFSTTPHNIYKNEWQGLNDFLGTPKPKNIGRKWRPFEDARRFVQSIGLRNVDEYKKWTRGNFRTDVPFPDDIPAEPPKGYKEEFRGFPDFLGSKPAAKYVEMWPFIKAREFVRNLHLPSSTQYFEWTKGNLPHLPAKPDEVPVVPRVKYREEWRGWNDWLGSGGPRTKTTQTAKSPSYESKQASASHPYEADPTST